MKVKEASQTYFTRPRTVTYQDYLNLPEDGNRYEVMNGELIMVPAPNTIHQDVSANVEYELKKFIEKHKVGKIYHAPIDVVLSETNVVQPDILFIAKQRFHIITEKNISGAPDLIIEILSPSTGYYDLIEKKEIYEKYGVQEYWIIDPKKKRVETYNNIKSKFKLNQRLEKKGILKSQILDEFEISLENIFNLE
jgi:Uma2 family endonuclease